MFLACEISLIKSVSRALGSYFESELADRKTIKLIKESGNCGFLRISSVFRENYVKRKSILPKKNATL